MKVFISHSHKDNSFLKILKNSLIENEIKNPDDAIKFQIGENIFKKIHKISNEVTHLLVVLSKSYVESKWGRMELDTFLNNNRPKLRILPILIESCEIPTVLRDGDFYNFTKDKDVIQLTKKLKEFFYEKQIKKSIKKYRQITKKTSLEAQISKIKKELKNGNLTLLCGAGISVDARVPRWNALIKTLLNRIFKFNKIISGIENIDYYSEISQEYFQPSPIIVAQYLKNSFGDDFHNHVREELYRDALPSCDIIESIAELARPQRALKSLNAIITYNFDDLIEQNLKRNSIKYKSIYKEGQKIESNELPVYHVHGFLPKNSNIDASSEIIFSEDSFRTQFSEPFRWSNLTQLNHLTQDLCILLGLSLTDPNLRRLLDVSMRKNPDRELNHYIFKQRYNVKSLYKFSKSKKISITEKECDALIRQVENLEEIDANNFGLNVVWVDNFDEIPMFLKEIRMN